MPVHRVRTAFVHEDVRDIEHQGERIVSAFPDPGHPDKLLIFTEYVRPALEVRG